MKNIKSMPALFAIMIIATMFIGGCRDKIYEEVTYTANVPVYMGFKEFRSSVKTTSPRQLINPGKIYFKNNLLYINEQNKGIHIVDNADPASPEIIAFIDIPGNFDLAVRGNILFADSYVDLVALDITNPVKPVELDRLKDAFPNVLPPIENELPIAGIDFTKGVIVGWDVKEHTETVERGSRLNKQWITYDGMGVTEFASKEVNLTSMNTGISGSMARFTISNTYLYAVHNRVLKIFNIGKVPGMNAEDDIQLFRMAETIFPYNNKLFLGTTTGMLVYGLTNPSKPELISTFEHINSCDPVVVQGDLAYVTLRSGTKCEGFTNQLDVVDISSIKKPVLKKSYQLFNPHGLGIDNNVLFICDGSDGLKVYDATDPMSIKANQLAHFQDIRAFDVIPVNGILMMIGADGLYQYDYSNQDNMVLLSAIPVVTDN